MSGPGPGWRVKDRLEQAIEEAYLQPPTAVALALIDIATSLRIIANQRADT